MRDDKKLFTRVTVESQLPDESTPHMYCVEVPHWDCTVDDMLDLFKSILLSMGYHPDNLKMFDEEYLETIYRPESENPETPDDGEDIEYL